MLLTSALSLVVVSAFITVAPVAGSETPQRAEARPSAIARMVCQEKAQTEIYEALGLRAVVTMPTWSNHLYSCTYRYPTGEMVLSVKELSSWHQTYGYFDTLARTLHRTIPIFELGQGAFRARDGSMVVRKDWKVLLVNVHGLPARFGSPPSTTSQVALTVAGVILACWHGD